jgi:hypothetical protein
LAIALGAQAEKRGRKAEAEAEFERACEAARLSHMPRPFADAMFHKIELRERNSDWRGAERLIPIALKADRELIDIQFLPQHLAEAAEIETHVGNIPLAREYLSQASDVIEAALARAPSPSVERSLISTMSGVFITQFELALNEDRNLPKAFEIVESAQSRVIAEHLRSADDETAVSTARTRALDAEIARIQLKLISSASTPRERSKSLRALDEAESELEAIQFSQNRHSHVARTVAVPLSMVQASLGANELLIEYVVSDNGSFALVVTRESSRPYKLPLAKDLDALVSAYAEEVMRPGTLPEGSRVQARRLFDAALGQVTELQRKQRLIIVPDGALDSVGFDPLVDPSSQYLIRSHTVSYVPSPTVLNILRNRPANSSAPYSILAFGAPELPNQLASASANGAAANRALLDISGGKSLDSGLLRVRFV